jgi:hypothetical protein
MEDIAFSCPSCGQSLEAPGDMAGETVPCPACNTNMIVPGAQPAPAGGAAGTAGKCIKCGEALPAGAVLCVHCGTNQKTGETLETELG